jgi:chaperone modulatory protein CbpM
MTEIFTEEQVLMRVTRLTRIHLVALIEAEAVVPARNETGPVFGPADLARLELLCELADLYDMEPEALAVTISVIDRMHAARRDRRALLDAIRAEAPEVRARIAASLARDRAARSGDL